VVSKTGASLLDNCYSKTLIDTHSMKTVDIKEEKDEICNLSGPGSDLDDFMEDDSHPVSSSDPMLSSPAPSTLSSSPSSFYSSDENLSPESIDHLIVWHPSLWIFSLLNVAKTILLAKNWRVFFAQLYIFCY